MSTNERHWVFLGDSLTEGIGSTRATYVTALARRLREKDGHPCAVHDFRLREVDPHGFRPYTRQDLAGYLDADPQPAEKSLWLWNLAFEGQTLDTDMKWLPRLESLRPERVFVYRGSLESIVRPAAVGDGQWPAWVPRSWRGLVAMDPRCYFSTTWYRWIKQAGIDALKQQIRLRLLSSRPGCPLRDADTVIAHYTTLLKGLRALNTAVMVLGLIPPDAVTFPGSAEHFFNLNTRLRRLAESEGAEFFDWAPVVAARVKGKTWRYRDGLHPTLDGAGVLAAVLDERIAGASIR